MAALCNRAGHYIFALWPIAIYGRRYLISLACHPTDAASGAVAPVGGHPSWCSLRPSGQSVHTETDRHLSCTIKTPTANTRFEAIEGV